MLNKTWRAKQLPAFFHDFCFSLCLLQVPAFTSFDDRRGIAWNKPHSIPKLYLVIVFISAIKPKNKTSSQQIIKIQTFQEKAITCTVKHKIYNVSLKSQNNKICKMKSTNVLLTNHGFPLKLAFLFLISAC